MKLTESDKLDIAKYVVELLTTSLRHRCEHDATLMKLDAWMERADAECIMRLGDYLKSYNRIGR